LTGQPQRRPSIETLQIPLPPYPPNAQAWVCLFDTLPKEWMDSVQLVLDYFCERTPRWVQGFRV